MEAVTPTIKTAAHMVVAVTIAAARLFVVVGLSIVVALIVVAEALTSPIIGADAAVDNTVLITVWRGPILALPIFYWQLEQKPKPNIVASEYLPHMQFQVLPAKGKGDVHPE
jgi:hypothetical protein